MTIQIFLAWLIASLLIAWAGRNKRMGFWGYLFASILLSPLIGLLLVVVSAPAKNRS